MKDSDMLKVLAFFVAGGMTAFAADTTDPRTRTFVDPVRVWGSIDATALMTPRFGQVAEGEFRVGSGPVLKRGEWVFFDFGRELHGGVQIGAGAKGGKNALAHVRFGESVSEAMSELGERGACNDHAIRDDVVKLPWYGRREIGETGFRFVRIDNAGDDPLQLEFVRAVSVMRSMTRLGSFRSSDERLNRIFETAVRTVHLCCQDYLWDGIKRDRLVWMGDTHPETMAILAVFGAVDVLPDSLDYMAATTPCGKWMNTMPTYTLWWIRNLAEWYRFTGDLAYLRKHADYLERTFEHVLSGLDEHGLWTAGNFLDWPTRHDDAAATAGTQGLAIITARETAFLARALGRSALEKKAEGMAKTLSALRPDPHGAKSAAALLALSGLRKPQEMFDGVLGRNGHLGVSTFYGYYMLEAMSAANENGRALETVRDYWGGMLDMGATSFWEDFNLAWTNGAFRIDEPRVVGKKDIHGDYGDFCYQGFRHSLCHGWSSGPAAWCINNVLGIRPLDVGCETVEVKPCLGDLDWAEGAMALPNGRAVKVRVEKGDAKPLVKVDAPKDVRIISEGHYEDKKWTRTFTIPEGAEADVCLPNENVPRPYRSKTYRICRGGRTRR